jgi:hypothetical protein
MEVAEGGTTVVASFSLSSSLKKNYSNSREEERSRERKIREKGLSTLMSQATQRYQGWNP